MVRLGPDSKKTRILGIEIITLWLIYILFAVSVVLSVLSATHLFGFPKRLNNRRQSTLVSSTLLVVGVLGILASAPGIFFGDWYWLTDKLFTLINVVI